MRKRHAFTLVEMLVVMAIIGIVAALVVGMAKAAGTRKRQAAVEADKAKIIQMIDSYQSKLNFFPPDNGGLINNTLGFAAYDALSATNPLLYELTGATNLTTGFVQLFDGTSNVTSGTYTNFFGRGAVANANPDEPHDFFNPGPQPKEYSVYSGSKANPSGGLCGLIVPVEGVTSTGTILATNNFWHYDASTTNRHNPDRYDLWAEYVIDNKNGAPVIITNGNW